MGMDRKIEQKRFNLKKILLYSLITIVVAAGAYYIVTESAVSTLNINPDTITKFTVKQSPFQEFIPINPAIYI